MKAKELMTGDWIKVSNVHTNLESKIGKCGRVVKLEQYPNYSGIAIKFDDELDTYFCELENEFEPIPLTPEILEKNGFKGEGYATLKLDENSHLQYYYHEHRLRKYWIGIDEWQNHARVTDITFQCNCYYVHELQHALRLCGIEKEITV